MSAPRPDEFVAPDSQGGCPYKGCVDWPVSQKWALVWNLGKFSSESSHVSARTSHVWH